jgi:hypothetical protein
MTLPLPPSTKTSTLTAFTTIIYPEQVACQEGLVAFSPQ